ncbi:MAG TPA: hypothetical protein VFJ91_05780 [Gaiellaceae bacterium]|nr:hypothetical protein [Gaiellaceae bacterium]
MSDTVADRLDRLADEAATHGGLGEKAAEPLHEDATFVRTLHPAGPRVAVKPLLPFAAAVGAAFLLQRLRGEDAARGPADRVRAVVARAGEELAERAWTVGRDARAEARKRRAWNALQGATGAVFTLLARRAATGVYEALTGGDPPRRG